MSEETIDDASIVEVKKSERRWSRGTTAREYTSKPRVYVWLDGESILENLANRFDRKPLRYRPFVKLALAELGIEYESFSWSQRAGCACGCSPGFILHGTEQQLWRYGVNPYDVHITIKGDRLQDAMTEEGYFRLRQLIGDKEATRLRNESRALIEA